MKRNCFKNLIPTDSYCKKCEYYHLCLEKIVKDSADNISNIKTQSLNDGLKKANEKYWEIDDRFTGGFLSAVIIYLIIGGVILLLAKIFG